MYVTWMDDPKVRRKLFAGRLRQITQLVDRIERDLADVQELVARMQQSVGTEQAIPESDDLDVRLSRDRSVTSTCWDKRPLIQEDSASL